MVTPADASGKVTFYDGTTILGVRTLADGQASLTTNLLASGARSLHAYYSGDASHAVSISAPLVQTVKTVPVAGFGPPSNFIIPNQTLSVAIGDLNGDGKDDLVFTTVFGSTVGVLLGNGDGTFQPLRTYYADSYPQSVSIADFNGDGIPDLVVASQGYPIYTSTVGVFIGQGDGTFQPRVDYPVGNGGGVLVVADFNGDGKADVAVTNSGDNSFSVFLGNGDGTLGRRTDYPTGATPYGIAVGDFNRDGNADIVLNLGDNSVGLFSGNGDGSFRAAVTFATEFHAGLFGAEDLNGDGIVDLVSVTSNGSVLLGNGDGTFRVSKLYDAPRAAGSFAVSDFNGDGKPDLVLADAAGNIKVLLNGGGTIRAPSNEMSYDDHSSVAVGDFNGDGKPDVAFKLSGRPGVYLGGVGTSTTTLLTSSSNPAVHGQSVTLTATISSPAATGNVTFYDGKISLGTKAVSDGQAVLTTTFDISLPHFLTAVYSGDLYYYASTSPVHVQIVNAAPTTTTLTSSPDPSYAGESVTLSATISPPDATGVVEFHDGPATIGSQTVSTGVGSFASSTLSAGVHSLTAVYLGDNNHSGSASQALNQTVTPATPTSMTLALSSAKAAYSQPVTLTAQISPAYASGKVTFYDGVTILGTQPIAAGRATLTTILLSAGMRSIRARYLGGEGYAPSISAVGSILIGTLPANSFGAPVTYASGAYSLTLGDFNGDGEPDLIAADSHGISILLGNGGGTYQAARAITSIVGGVSIGDFNGDGKTDLVITGDSNVSVFLGNGDGTFQPPIDNNTGNCGSVVDVNGDGKADLICGSGSVLLGNGDGTLQPLSPWVPNGIEVFGDFNGDGKTDFVSKGTVLLGNDDGTFRTRGTISGTAVDVADFNNDGNIDVVSLTIDYPPSRPPISSVRIYLGRGDGTLQPPDPIPGVFGPSGYTTPGPFAVGDFNGDGNLDLAIAESSYGFIYLGHGNGTFDLSINFTSDGRSRLVVGDFNGDGITDLGVVYNGERRVLPGRLLPASTTTLTSSPNPSTYGDSVIFTASVSPADTTGSVTFYDGLNVVGATTLKSGIASFTTHQLLPGQHPLTARYAGDGNFFASTSAILLQTVTKATPSVTLVSSSNPASLGQSVLLTVTLSNPLATGTITFIDGQQTIGTQAVQGAMAHLAIATLAVGAHPLTAVFNSGDPNDNPNSSAILTQTINQGTKPSVLLSTSVNPATYSQRVTLTGIVTGPDGAPSASGTVTFYDGSKYLGSRLLSAGQANLTTKTLATGARLLRVYYSGDGTYNPGNSQGLAQTVSPVAAITLQEPLNQTGPQGVDSMAVGDFDGDGVPDLAIGDYNQLYVFPGNGDGTFRAPLGDSKTGSNFSSGMAVADFNGDGFLDLVGTGSGNGIAVQMGNGDGTFQPTAHYVGGRTALSLAVADVNGDGRPDIVVGDYVIGQYNKTKAVNVGLLLGNGDGTFQPLTHPTTYENLYVQALIAADFNGDGVPDLAITDSNSVSILLGTGDGTLQAGANYAVGGGTGAIATGDFNGDGKPDLAIATLDGAVTVLPGNGDGTFQSATVLNAGGAVVSSAVAVVAGDFNGDGHDDLALSNQLGVSVILGNGDGSFQDPVYYGAGCALVASADLDGDGRTDLIISNSTSNQSQSVSILLGSSDPVPSVSSSGIVNAADPLNVNAYNPSSVGPAGTGRFIVPGSLATAFGNFVLTSPATASGSPLPNELSGLSLQINGLSAPLVSVSNGKVTFQVPWELTGQSKSDLSVTVNGRTSAAKTASLSPYAPGIYSANGQGVGQALAYDLSGHLIDASNPAIAGSTIVEIYATGLGAVSNQPATGFTTQSSPPSVTNTIPDVTIGWAPVVVLFSGLVPGKVGVYQISAIVPSYFSAQPALPVQIRYQGLTTNGPTIAVK